MSQLFNAINNTTQTTNGAVAYKSTGTANLDFFFLASGARGQDSAHLVSEFNEALFEDGDLAVRCLQWLRDIREGAGERQLFLDILASSHMSEATKITILRKIPELGRWKDLLHFVEESGNISAEAIRMIGEALKNGNGLCAKWMPRQGPKANILRKHLKYSPKAWRKTLVELSKTVEQQMCAKQWDKIDFEKVPSVAASRYHNAFYRNAEEQYTAYKDKLVKGEAKINAAAVYPYDIVRSVLHNRHNAAIVDVATAQWKALPDYMEDSVERILPIVDVSGSMDTPVSGSVTALHVAMSLGLYISERNKGMFKDCIVTFSEKPEFVVLNGGLKDRLFQLANVNWGMNTNLEAVFEKLLKGAVANSLTEEEMPTKLLILSDMQFDGADYVFNKSVFENIKQEYSKAGYKAPEIVFWNINSPLSSVPVSKNEAGVALVGGFSPSILKGILKGSLSPEKIMLDTLLKDRYNWK